MATPIGIVLKHFRRALLAEFVKVPVIADGAFDKFYSA